MKRSQENYLFMGIIKLLQLVISYLQQRKSLNEQIYKYNVIVLFSTILARTRVFQEVLADLKM